ncbi:MAG: RNA-binding S4 domain-containing protein [Bacteroidales bacterium]|nr:RNA-binding S4 domain-containing protein [Bacteroidales bacterium]
MRIDKFLFCVRLFKTRSQAAEACGRGRILVNGVAVKPAREVKEGDEVSVKANPVFRKYRISALLKSRVGAAKVPLYITETTSQEDLLKLKLMSDMARVSYGVRDRGAGRPTKKDRREIDRFYDDAEVDFDVDFDDDYDDELDGFTPDFDGEE